ncbi:hypothetical protein IIB97_02190 [Patescibacteria group bacterium]|nr:hypothetical protein [Patescibacteria group bacterium]
MNKEEKLSEIYEQLLSDALQDDTEVRYFKLSDKDLHSIINAMSENWTPKQVRSTLRDQTEAPKTLDFEDN